MVTAMGKLRNILAGGFSYGVGGFFSTQDSPVGILVDDGPQEIVYQTVTGELLVSGSDHLVSGAGAENFDAVSVCVGVISDTVAAIPFFATDADGDRVETVFDDLVRRPNPYYRWTTLTRRIVSDLLLWGNAYLYIVRDGSGAPLSVWPIPASRVEVRFDSETGAIVYIVDGTPVPNFPGELPLIAHLMQNPWEDFPPEGRSAIRASRPVVAHGMAADRLAVNTAMNGQQRYALVRKIRAGTATSTEIEATPAQRQKMFETWRKATHGAKTWNDTPVLPMGWEPVPLSMSATDMDLLSHLKLDRLRIASIFKVPPLYLNDLDRATFQNADQQARAFVQRAVLPIVTEMQDVFHAALLNAEPELRVEYDLDPVTRAEPAVLVAQKAQEIAAGIRTPEQAAQDLGYEYDAAYWEDKAEQAAEAAAASDDEDDDGA